MKDNGGPTKTIALQFVSPAIDAANDAVCDAAPVNGVDQRGVSRHQGSHCDIGAYEREGGVQTFDDASNAVQFNGWKGKDNAAASGGSYRTSNTQNDTVTFDFTGNAVKWVSHKGPDMGKAQITIDGVDKGTVDLYRATDQWLFTKTIKKLTNAKHTLVIRVLGTKNASSAGKKVDVDAFKVAGVVTEETSPGVKFNKWAGKSNAAASGGTYRSSPNANALASFTFSGTEVAWVTAKGPKFGNAQVLIDGSDQGVFHLYEATKEWKVAIPFTISGAGQHIIEIHVLGDKDAASGGKAVVVDAFLLPSH